MYQAIIGPGAVKDLFKSEVEGGEAPTPPQEGEVPAVQGEQSAVNAAQKVMNQNTPMLDYKGQDTVEQVQEAEQEAAVQEATGEAGEREIAEGDNADGEKKKKKGLFARVKNLVSKPSKPLS